MQRTITINGRAGFFGMEREDYEEKKILCKQLVYELREMEALLKTQ